MAQTFTTDAALKSALFAACPYITVRKDLEYNEWQAQPIAQSWLNDGNRVFVDCGHDKADKIDARGEFFAECKLLNDRIAASKSSKVQRMVAQLQSEAVSAKAGKADQL